MSRFKVIFLIMVLMHKRGINISYGEVDAALRVLKGGDA